MAKLTIYDIDGKDKGEVSVDSIPDGFSPNENLITRSLKRQLANARIPCAHSKSRSMVRGGGRKPYRQKGTGRARQGSIRAAQFRGGSVVFGPKSERNFTLKMNRKERSAAIRHLVWSKIKNDEWKLFADLNLDVPSTKKGKAFIQALGCEGKVLVLMPDDERFLNVKRSLKNLPEITLLPPERLNSFDLLNNTTVIAHEQAFDSVRKIWGV